MDANKLVVLKEIGYEVQRTCANCVHSFFPSERSEWGTCEATEYQHEKHTGDARKLSINKSGRCKDGHALSMTAFGMLGGFQELMKL